MSEKIVLDGEVDSCEGVDVGLPEIGLSGTAAPIPRLPTSNFKESLRESSMATYHFDTEDAAKYGVECSIVLYNIRFWIKKNAANKTHFHDGAYWTYNSAKAFVELFPFWNWQKIGRLLRKLEDAGAIRSGNYNRVGFDKTKWYSIVNDRCSDMNDGALKSERPIPDINTDKKQHIYIGDLEKKSPNPKTLYSPEFEAWWLVYKIGNKMGAFDAWKKLSPTLEEISDMTKTAPIYKTYCLSVERTLKDGQGWINGRFWESEWTHEAQGTKPKEQKQAPQEPAHEMTEADWK